GRAGGADDNCGPTIEASKEHSAHVIVTGVALVNPFAVDAGAEVRDLDIGFGLHRSSFRLRPAYRSAEATAVVSTTPPRRNHYADIPICLPPGEPCNRCGPDRRRRSPRELGAPIRSIREVRR